MEIKERPIAFNAETVKAILENKEATTRRVVKLPKQIKAILSRAYVDYGLLDLEQYLKVPCADGTVQRVFCPYDIGDRLWVKETFVIESDINYGYTEAEIEEWRKGRPVKEVDGGVELGHYHLIPHYRATEPELCIVTDEQFSEGDDHTLWKSSIRMPRWASRLTLEITDIKVEFSALWDSINANWVISFRRIEDE